MRKPPFGASLASLIAILLLCGLGAWQVQRLQWKTALLAQLDRAYRDPNPPQLSLNRIQYFPGGPNDFSAARLHGHFLPGEIQLGVRTWNEEAGYHAIAAFAMEGGGSILVDRGWVPAAQRDPQTRLASLPINTPITLTGLLHAPGPDNFFVPANKAAQGLWYRWDIPKMGVALRASAPVTPLILYEESEPGAGKLPVRAALRLTLPNNHLSYAIFWFALAAILAVIFYIRFMRGARRDGNTL